MKALIERNTSACVVGGSGLGRVMRERRNETIYDISSKQLPICRCYDSYSYLLIPDAFHELDIRMDGF
jgi:hypothetical protein